MAFDILPLLRLQRVRRTTMAHYSIYFEITLPKLTVNKQVMYYSRYHYAR